MRTQQFVWVGLLGATMAFAQGRGGVRDPGPRDASAGAGQPVPGLTAKQLALFNDGLSTFTSVDSVSGTIPGESDSGLGPSFNSNSCGSCHAFPAVGGTSPRVNPQIAVATLDGAQNKVPPFLTINSPVREARFVRNADGSADGGVHDLFVITGRSDAPAGCALQQTDFNAQLVKNNVVFRIPTPNFGNGLMEAIPDAAILANKAANAAAKSKFGIGGHENRSGNDGTITRFGWKAQNKSLMIFAGEAYAVEQGVTNDFFPNPRETSDACAPSGQPEDHVDYVTGEYADTTNFDLFMRFLGPLQPVSSYGNVTAASVTSGQAQFAAVGCALCHTPMMTTGPSSADALSNKPVPLYSDLLVHRMGQNLADGVTQGSAEGDEFRSAPLWGLGQRLFFLHDGRVQDLMQAILQHAGPGSEANQSINAFNALPDNLKQDLLNFLRSL